jgi:hypothetical protein
MAMAIVKQHHHVTRQSFVSRGISSAHFTGSVAHNGHRLDGGVLGNVAFERVPFDPNRTHDMPPCSITACRFDVNSQLTHGDCEFEGGLRYVGGLKDGLYHGRGDETDTTLNGVFKGNFVRGLASGPGVYFVKGLFDAGGLYDGVLVDCETPIAQRGYTEDTVRALKELFNPERDDSFWDQEDAGDDEHEDDGNNDGDDGHDLANSESDDQSMGPKGDHNSGINSAQCNGQQAVGEQENGRGVSKKPRSRSRRRNAKKADEAAGGFTTQTHRSYEIQYGKGSLATGKRRDCAVLAAFNSMPDALHEQGIDVPMLRRLMPNGGRTQDTAFSTLQTFFLEYNYDLKCVTEGCRLEGGPALNLLKKTTGRFVVQLRVALNGHDKEPDWHCVAFNADTQKVIDNDAKMDPRCLEPSDTKSKTKALKVFKSFFKHGTIVEVNNI